MRFGRRQQTELGNTALDAQLHARGEAIGVFATWAEFIGSRAGKQHSARTVFDRDCGRRSEWLVVGTEQSHRHLHARLAVGRNGVAIEQHFQRRNAAIAQGILARPRVDQGLANSVVRAARVKR